ncbi:SDR family NAD(P)-dependent oxidoreductase [Kutzneria viridogrisea]|uniref:Ketoreductase domain-containing protein n=2 Tax=Kutzneria TaxID=43356 RepID=W5WJP3_9PSEU|nr:SDR family NAD(P)-dependent oxidoreductase [Kutzneria albida]AHH98384.1 hypothetical protein KALB_5022 [Kutzneria albida DSM 43870]MBA8924096.1 NAD(P)-dependent dehydrogenase (short-subunit alcohol dehydrogenase family) [Kutzneria viridogrisea]
MQGCFAADPVALLAGERGPLADLLAERLRAEGWTVHTGPGAERLDLVLWLGGDHLADALLTARDTLPVLNSRRRTALVTVARRAEGSGLSGLVKTAVIETSELFGRAVDLHPELAVDRCADLVLAELHDSQAALTHVSYDEAGQRWHTTVDGSPRATGTAALTPQDVVLVTGGARGITADCVLGLAKRYRPALVLLGRTRLAEEPVWAQGVPEDKIKPVIAARLERPTPREVEPIYRDLLAQRQIRATLASIRAAGAQADYLAVDITDADAVAAALAPYRERITGLVHGAGVLADQLITDKTRAEIERVLAPKIGGLRAVLGALDADRLRHVVLFSSVAGFFGNRGQSDYAMANEQLNAEARVFKREHPAASVVSINWGAWAGGMVTPALQRMFAERGVTLIPVQEGVRHFVEQFAPERPDDVVCVIGPSTPLSSPAPRSAGVTVVRDLAELAASPVITDHAIGGLPVLPVTVAIGAMLNAVARIRREPCELAAFSVLKGVVFTERNERLRLRITGNHVTALDERDRPRYRAELSAPTQCWAPPLAELGAGEPLPVYGDGTLFHGPTLRGLRTLHEDGDRLVIGCQLADVPLADGAYAAPNYSPVLADLLLQAALVWVRRSRGQASLPVAVGRVQSYGALPDGEPFVMIVEPGPQGESRARCTVTARTPQGEVLLRFAGVDLVCSTALGEKFTLAGAGVR